MPNLMWAKVFEEGEETPLEAEAAGDAADGHAVAALLRDNLKRTE